MAAKPKFGIVNKGGQMELNDNYTVVAELKTRIRKFVTDRDWDQYHYPKDLAIGLAIEAAELLEHFRFRSNDELEELATDTEFRQCVAHELADVLYFVLLMCSNLRLDASSILTEKLAINAEKYPVNQSRGSNIKYTDLLSPTKQWNDKK